MGLMILTKTVRVRTLGSMVLTKTVRVRTLGSNGPDENGSRQDFGLYGPDGMVRVREDRGSRVAQPLGTLQ